MCLITFQYNKEADYPFILLANRDEEYTRPSVGIHFWMDEPNLLAGRDLKAKGTWLGITRTGKFATLINHPFTNWSPDNPVTRGNLVTDYVTSSMSAKEYHEQLRQSRTAYDGFHFLYGDIHKLHLYSNMLDEFLTFEGGKTYSVSNTDDHLSLFRKERSIQLLDNYLEMTNEININELVELFHDTKKSPQMTRYPDIMTKEEALNASSIFIEDDVFGTLATTVILVDRNGIVREQEVRYMPDGPVEATTKKFKITN